MYKRQIFATDIRELSTPSVGASGIAENNTIAQVGPILHFMEKVWSIGRFGAAVDVQNHRIFFAVIKAYRFDNPAFDLVSRFVLEGQLFRRGDGVLFGQMGIQMGQLRLLAR